MEFRPAQEQDLSVIATFPTSADELYFVHPSARFPLTAEQLMPNFQQRKGNTVVLMDGNVVGFANYINVIDGEEASIGNLIIDPAQRGSGIGKAFLQELARQAKQEYGVQRILIPCFNKNTYGLHFYHSLGYVPYLGEPRLDQDGKPIFLIWLQKAV